MKLIVAVVQDQDQSLLMDALLHAGIRATKLKSQGSFLRSGNTTFIIGVDDNDVDNVLHIIERNCKAREQYTAGSQSIGFGIEIAAPVPEQVEVGGAIVFVLPVDQMFRF